MHHKWNSVRSGALVLLAALLGLHGKARAEDPTVVDSVDFQRYVGFWYEIAHAPNFFQNGCVRSSAEYGIKSPTEVTVHNVCTKEDGSTSDISGVATVVDPAQPAKLRVRFNIFAQGDYWITELDPNYEWAVVSAPGKSSLFILARQAPMTRPLLDQILNRLNQKGFDTSNLIYDQY